jgi:peptidoglycan/LPS O-acetylase OafA/YrhL
VIAVAFNHVGMAGFGGGFVGVDVFFVISGFLITGILLRDVGERGRPRILGFYAHRARRILPLAAVVLLFCLVVGYQITGAAQGNVIATAVVWAGVFGANWHFISVGNDYFAQGTPTSPLQHFWSLGVEEQFYLVWPVVLTLVVMAPLVRRRRPSAIMVLLGVICVASLAWSIWQTHATPIEAYFSPFTRAWELGLGAALAALAAYKPRWLARLGPEVAAAGLVAVIVSVTAFDSSTPFPGYAALLPVLGTGLVIAAGISSEPRDVSGSPSVVVIFAGFGRLLQKMLRSRPAQFVGQRSYGFYLWHFPFLQFALLHFGHAPPLWVSACLLVAALAVADLTYLLVEGPTRHSKLLVPRPVLSVGFGVVLVVGVVAASVGAQAAHPIRSIPVTSTGSAADAAVVHRDLRAALSEKPPADLAARVDDAQIVWNPAWWGTCVTSATQTIPDGCVLGDVHGSRTWVLFGDSHVQMLFHPMDEIARRNHARLIVYTKAACGPYAGVPIWDTIRNQPFTECDAFNDNALADIARIKPDVVVISGLPKAIGGGLTGRTVRSFPSPDLEAVWAAGESRTITAAEGAGARVVVVGDIPEASSDPATCLRAHLGAPQQCAGVQSQVVFAGHNAAEQAAVEQAGATYVPMVDLMCLDDSCPAVIAGRVVYRDQWHLTASFAMYLVNVIAERGGLG